jgi:predicted CoA-substrate-specific enzyme activase
MLDPKFLGVDVGSVSVSTALINSSGQVARAGYRFHKGKVRETLRSLIVEMGPVRLAGIALASAAPFPLKSSTTFDSQVSLIAAARRFFPSARSILFVGGERFGLIRLDADGVYLGARTNSSCAAGTGSFLDQQARRLGFSGIEELVSRARACTTRAPKISTRCAVFARTDLVHAQQEGYSLEEISSGLCRGLAQNIVDTLLGGERPDSPVVFAGGVALNAAVRGSLEEIIGVPLLAHQYASQFGAIGAALCLAEQSRASTELELGPDVILDEADGKRQYFFEPLELEEPDGASRDGEKRYRFEAGTYSAAHPVEVDVYREPAAGSELAVRMGIDIGSTSTKAIIIDEDRTPVAGFYTRTLGSPLTAVQAICEAFEDWETKAGAAVRFLGVGTTGAGRKFIGAIIGADLVVDEITAHAKAAWSLDPRIDTIIEIGGQDAKFTTMRDGMVTFSHMNTVCAAGTGSFLEEQAERLGCRLADYQEKVRGARAPLSSDRCAVFMERDINNFLATGFATEEILAAALYSVRENYLQKVARGAAMGNRIAFQGATARNQALVAAFRRGLGKPISVSKYCHLTGALGAALILAERNGDSSRFLGMAALRAGIPVRTETCELCANHCRLRIASVGGQAVAYGFLCGRDYDQARYVDRNRSGFDLFKVRREAFSQSMKTRGTPPAEGPIVGIPAALGLWGELPVWKSFFSSLGIRTVTSERFEKSIDQGREVQGAEFCAPLAALHGHVRHLRDKADWIFLPVFLEEDWPRSRKSRVYCYYTQYSAALVSGAADPDLRRRCLMPQVSWTKWRERTKRELHKVLAGAGFTHLTHRAVSRAFELAAAGYDDGVKLLQKRYRQEMASSTEPCVMLLGRPYNVLSPEMSKGIPGIFGSLGIKTFYMDMVPDDLHVARRVEPLLDSVHWVHAAAIIEAACIAADTPNLYPVYITSFKCTPDSFALEYFKRILDEKEKPYLILQLDDHDSTLGYETRIEAGVAAFRNHYGREHAASSGREHAASSAREGRPARAPQSARKLPIAPRSVKKLDGRTLLYPNWDPLVNPLLVAILRREGVDARLLEEDPVMIRKAMRQNTGQCLPLNIIAQESVDYVRAHALDPARTALWMPESNLSCNMGMFTPFIKSLMEAEGGGMEKVQVYAGDMFFLEFPRRATVNTYKAYLAGGLLRRVGCRLRPYERSPGRTDAAIAEALRILQPAFEGGGSLDQAIGRAAGLFDAVEIRPGRKPRVAIFGDLYVRDNDIMNQGLVRAIEEAGAEAITTPYTEYVRIIVGSYFRKWAMAGEHLKSLTYRTVWVLADALGRRCQDHFARFLDPETPVDHDRGERFAAGFGIRAEHAGESFENLLKISHLVQAHPELALFVQASPAFCCPSMVTEAMARDIERVTGVPVVSITYDGTGQYRNEVLVPYVRYARSSGDPHFALSDAEPDRAESEELLLGTLD